ncbi:MAG: DNA-directed RNA polymerase subunit beta' [Lachnospiraceae bacterium]|nr:DNA-directed RNA polymerase subunit beta' [Lachnospiraceae bacterium]
MAETRKETYEPISFDSIRIGLASPEKIREWSHGIVTKPETINYRTLKPEKDGLFCERIFGPSKDWECYCGKYKKIRFKGVVCDRCGVEVTKASVRRERMGHIELASPVSHIWYFKGIPSRMALALNMSSRDLDRVLYFAGYVVLDPGNTGLEYKQVLNETDYRNAVQTYGYNEFRVGMGAEAVKEMLRKIDVEKEAAELREEIATASPQKRAKLVKREEVMEAFIHSGNKPEWMILDCLPVIPPDLRPMVQLDGGRFATSDLNDLYRRIINRNNRLQKLFEQNSPEIIVRNEKRMLQEAVDALIDNGRRGRAVTGAGNRALKSLSDMLKGKQGRFRQNLLGKRVDYSGRSVIVVGPELKIYQCGLPKEMAIELFKPFVMKELVFRQLANNIKQAKKMVDRLDESVWDILEDVIREHPVMLNRAPTLHRLGIQAFEPILVEGKAIKLHPLVCTAFNADFDGDQMAVHLPLSEEAQAECRFLMLSPNNLLKPSDGGPVAVPSQDMVLGIYYLTQERKGTTGEGSCFTGINEAILAQENGYLDMHAPIKVRVNGEFKGKPLSGMVETTLGRMFFNEIIPQDLGYVDRTKKANALLPEINFLVDKGKLKGILERVINVHGATKTAEVLDDIKAIGYKYSTKAGMTVSISDMIIPKEKEELLEKAQKQVAKIAQNYRRGLITESERYQEVISTWNDADAELTNHIYPTLGEYNNIYMMAVSGARGSKAQIKQLIGWRGLMATTTGHTIELPVRSNFREGLNVLEYFMSSHGSRKGMSDMALRTADSGYLTRRLVDVAQDIIIREEDCAHDGEIPFMEIRAFKDGGEVIESLRERLVGRFAAEDIVDENGELVIEKDNMITPRTADRIVAVFEKTGRDSMKIRTNLSCRSHFGVCAKCYGANMATGEPVQVGEAVGIIAAQAIGEPGTQLTLRTFHTGGVAGENITTGLPRVEELFEARNPKGVSILSEISGEVTIRDTKKKREVVVTNDETGDSRTYLVTFGSNLAKRDGVELQTGDHIEAGEKITEGNPNPHDVLRISGLRAVQDYMLHEVQRPYRRQGVDINDKHIEIIVRQMLKKIRVDEAGDSDILPGSTVDTLNFNETNEQLQAEGKTPMQGTQIMLGITKASLATESFLSAASFQETTRVLTEAAIMGKVDHLSGLKENVQIGNLIPAGTGLRRYRNLRLDSDERFEEEMRQKSAYEEAMREAAKKRAQQEAEARQAAEKEEESEESDDGTDTFRSESFMTAEALMARMAEDVGEEAYEEGEEEEYVEEDDAEETSEETEE